MPLCYQFTNQSTGKTEKLDTIDRLLCEATGFPYSEKEYGLPYKILTIHGLVIVSKFSVNKTTITKEAFDKFKEFDPDAFTGEDYWRIAEQFLITDYEFSVWYQR